jgi:hypothetical protein
VLEVIIIRRRRRRRRRKILCKNNSLPRRKVGRGSLIKIYSGIKFCSEMGLNTLTFSCFACFGAPYLQ